MKQKRKPKFIDDEHIHTLNHKKKRKLTREERYRRDVLFVVKFFLTLAIIIAIIIFCCNYSGFDIVNYKVSGNTYTHNYNDVLDKYLNKNIFTRNKSNMEKQIKKANLIEFISVKKYNKRERSKVAKINKDIEKEKRNYNILSHRTKENKTISKIDKVIIKRKLPNKLEITIKEKKPVCCFVTKNGQFLINDTGRIFHKIKKGEKYFNIPTVYNPKNNIVLGEEITKIQTLKTTFLFELAKLCYYNDLNIKSIQFKNEFEIIMYTKNGILINFGVTADLIDKTYFLKQIFREKSSMIDQISEIYIINSNTATYKLKNNGQNIKN